MCLHKWINLLILLMAVGINSTLLAVNVSLPEITGLSSGQSVEIPITISDVSGAGIISYYADINFTEAVLNCTGVVKTGTLSSGWGAPAVNLSQDGKVTIAAYGTQPLTGQGTILKLVFTVVGLTGNGSPLNFDVFQFNEGNPPAITQNGYASVGQPNPPATPVLELPVNGAINIPVQTSLSWNEATNARYYQLQVSTSSNFSGGIIVDQSNIISTSYQVNNLLRGTAYYWRVKSIGYSANSNWSQVSNFTTILNNLPDSNLPTDVSIQEDNTYSLDIQSLFSDADGDPVTVNVSSSAHITASLNQMTLLLVPLADWNGSEAVNFTINDGFDTVQDSILVTVTPVNDAPIINLPASFTFEEDDSLIVDMSTYISDVDNTDLTVIAQSSAHVFVAMNGLNATFTSTPNWNGTNVVLFTVSDGLLNTTGQVNTIVIPVNDAPVINLPATFTFAEDGSLSIHMGTYVSDIDDVTLTVTAQNSAHVFVAFTDLNATVTSTENWSGSETVSFTVSDGTLTATGQTSITVTPVNDAPIINLPASFTFEEDDSLIVDMSTYINDVDNTDLTVIAQSSAHVFVAMNGLNATFTSTPNWNGTNAVLFTVSDGLSIANGQANVTVSPVNDSPVINLPSSFTFAEDTQLLINMSLYTSDIDNATLTLSATGNQNVTVSISAMSVALGSLPNWSGTEQITFTVNDNMGRAIATDSTHVIVTPVNDAPIINLPASFTFEEDDSLIVDMSTYISDVDNTVLTLTAQGSTHISVVMSGLNATFISSPNWNGTESLSFTVSDGTLIATDQINVIVSPVNDAPTINLPDSFTYAEDGQLVINIADYASDIDGNPLTVTASGNQNVTVSITGMFVTLGAFANWYGTEQVTFSVNDDMGRVVASDTADVIVSSVNDAPVITSFTPTQTAITVNLYDSVIFSVEASDIDSPISYSWFVNDVNQNIATSEFTYQITQNATYTVKAVVSDEDSSVEQLWTISVSVGNDDEIAPPDVTQLYPGYPNPFNPETTIKFSLANPGWVNVSIYDIKGALIKVLINETEDAGVYNVVWDGRTDHNVQVSSGLYFVKMQTVHGTYVKKITLCK